MRRLRADLVLTYKILFGVACINSNTLFMLRNQPHVRDHNYTLINRDVLIKLDEVFFCTTVVNVWNSLPAGTTDFSSLRKFSAPVSINYLLRFCRPTVYFE